MNKRIALLWKPDQTIEGRLEVSGGTLSELNLTRGRGKVSPPGFTVEPGEPTRIEIALSGASVAPGADTTRISVVAGENSFNFFLRDVSSSYPIYLPDHEAIVTEADDTRSFDEIVEPIRAKGLQTKLEEIESQPEETYEDAAAHCRSLRGPTWLGLSRDVRIFEVDFGLNLHNYVIRPRLHGTPVQREGTHLAYAFVLGRGQGCTEQITRHIEDGCLPILRATRIDDDVHYDSTTFVTLEKSPLTAATLEGTNYLIADGYAAGHRFTEEQEKERARLLETGKPAEETVLYLRCIATNTAKVPRYAWFMAANPNHPKDYDGAAGFGLMKDGNVFSVNLLDGKPMPQEEMAVLLPPGRSATFEFRLPHSPVSRERAENLEKQTFADRHAGCRAFWLAKLDASAKFQIPEQRVAEMARAGLNHLDLVAYGSEPDGPVAATIGVYSPIGSESSPIIQFFDSVGRHDLAARCLRYFLEKQHDDGFMQNFDGYMLETGAALWSIGEHFRYTRDESWARDVKDKVLKSCNFILDWRERNKDESMRGKGYGLLNGKVGDPEDQTRQFLLNGYAYLGLARTVEMLATIDPAESKRIAAEAQALKEDIRTALYDALGRSPVVPLGDGTWVPSAPAWAEADDPTWLLVEGVRRFTHGTFTTRESLVGPHYLAYQEILDPDERAMDWILNVHAGLLHDRNVAFSQPYYSRHDWPHLRRGEVKAFLKTYYNGFAGLSDRETYSFWEHYFYASPHKTHEEGWFLMQTRWMLYMEDGETLNLLPGIPRAWLENGKTVGFENAASYFGPISLTVHSDLDNDTITAKITCDPDRKPETIRLRLPHPQYRRAKRASQIDRELHSRSLTYDAETETVVITPVENVTGIALDF